jgi:hypothetical protein
VSSTHLVKVGGKEQRMKTPALSYLEGETSMKRNDTSEMMRLIRQISNNKPTHEGVEKLAAYGAACVEPLIREAKHVDGQAARARGYVIYYVGISAFPILYELVFNFDREIRVAAADGLGHLNYQGHVDLHRRAIQAVLKDIYYETNPSIKQELAEARDQLVRIWDMYQTEPKRW